jgi:hypothetical protein
MKKLIAFVINVALLTVAIEICHSAFSPDYRRRVSIDYQLRHPIHTMEIYAQRNGAVGRAFMDCPIDTARLIIASFFSA